jgi:hypothetical protein
VDRGILDALVPRRSRIRSHGATWPKRPEVRPRAERIADVETARARHHRRRVITATPVAVLASCDVNRMQPCAAAPPAKIRNNLPS